MEEIDIKVEPLPFIDPDTIYRSAEEYGNLKAEKSLESFENVSVGLQNYFGSTQDISEAVENSCCFILEMVTKKASSKKVSKSVLPSPKDLHSRTKKRKLDGKNSEKWMYVEKHLEEMHSRCINFGLIENFPSVKGFHSLKVVREDNADNAGTGNPIWTEQTPAFKITSPELSKRCATGTYTNGNNASILDLPQESFRSYSTPRNLYGITSSQNFNTFRTKCPRLCQFSPVSREVEKDNRLDFRTCLTSGGVHNVSNVYSNEE